MITGAQIRAARKLLGWPRDRLCPRAGLSVTVLRKIEDGRTSHAYKRTACGIQGALEAAGVEFTNGDEPGVKLKATKMNGRA
jgi:transcriptional regulator with XRE-family HTH domain